MSELIFMGIQGPETATTEELLQKAAAILGVGRDHVELVDEVRPGEACLNASMPDGYYADHEEGESIEEDGHVLSWEPA